MIELRRPYLASEAVRKQIGAYQAIKHQLATAQVKLELARPVLYAAATRVGSLDPVRKRPSRTQNVGQRRRRSCRADITASTRRHGYSWEVDLHFFMKRAWAWRRVGRPRITICAG